MLDRLWPLPALFTWGAAWWLFLRLAAPVGPVAALLAACCLGALASFGSHRPWRRAWLALGFPLSALLLLGLASGQGAGGLWAMPAWAWLLPLAVLLALYPLHSWRDAPLFPTPAQALQPLAAYAPLPAGALVLDAGCGLGHGLQALRQAYPQAHLHGLEWSWPLALLCRLRCRPWAQVQRGDIWATDWGAYQLVYLFQRPETMARAGAKAQAEMRPGSYLVSLAFPIADWPASASYALPATSSHPAQTVWVYCLPNDE